MKKGFYISSFDGAHLSMPQYTEQYDTEKNIGTIRDSLTGAHADQSTLQWQFGLRSGSQVLSGDRKLSHHGSRRTLETNTQAATKNSNHRLETEEDPLEGMVPVPEGGFNLAKCIPEEDRLSEEMLKHQIINAARNSGQRTEVTFQTGGSRHFQGSSGTASVKRGSTKIQQPENQSYRATQ